tara:strand:+ start:9591 stop:10118 length:528 start_codon:yes stop_codon:yes gene_type:complete
MALTQANLTQGSGLTVTNNVVTGTGVFDDLMEAVTTHLEAQYQLGRITGGDFATVYLGAMQSALQQSVAYTIGQEKTNAEVALLTQKQTTEFAQTLVTGNTTPNANSVMGKDITLKGEQAKGFKWNADQKYLKTLIDAWTINTNVAGTPVTTITALNATGTGNLNTQIANAEPTG